MIFKDGKTFSAYVRSKLHSGYITFPVREKLANVEQTGKVREFHTKYWKN